MENYVRISLETHLFFARIMKEHALFIRGLLDPSEEELIQTANGFAMDYRKLLEEAKQQDGRANGLAGRSLEETRKLREANHYIRILESGYE